MRLGVCNEQSSKMIHEGGSENLRKKANEEGGHKTLTVSRKDQHPAAQPHRTWVIHDNELLAFRKVGRREAEALKGGGGSEGRNGFKAVYGKNASVLQMGNETREGLGGGDGFLQEILILGNSGRRTATEGRRAPR